MGTPPARAPARPLTPAGAGAAGAGAGSSAGSAAAGGGSAGVWGFLGVQDSARALGAVTLLALVMISTPS